MIKKDFGDDFVSYMIENTSRSFQVAACSYNTSFRK